MPGLPNRPAHWNLTKHFRSNENDEEKYRKINPPEKGAHLRGEYLGFHYGARGWGSDRFFFLDETKFTNEEIKRNLDLYMINMDKQSGRTSEEERKNFKEGSYYMTGSPESDIKCGLPIYFIHKPNLDHWESLESWNDTSQLRNDQYYQNYAGEKLNRSYSINSQQQTKISLNIVQKEIVTHNGRYTNDHTIINIGCDYSTNSIQSYKNHLETFHEIKLIETNIEDKLEEKAEVVEVVEVVEVEVEIVNENTSAPTINSNDEEISDSNSEENSHYEDSNTENSDSETSENSNNDDSETSNNDLNSKDSKYETSVRNTSNSTSNEAIEETVEDTKNAEEEVKEIINTSTSTSTSLSNNQENCSSKNKKEEKVNMEKIDSEEEKDLETDPEEASEAVIIKAEATEIEAIEVEITEAETIISTRVIKIATLVAETIKDETTEIEASEVGIIKAETVIAETIIAETIIAETIKAEATEIEAIEVKITEAEETPDNKENQDETENKLINENAKENSDNIEKIKTNIMKNEEEINKATEKEKTKSSKVKDNAKNIKNKNQKPRTETNDSKTFDDETEENIMLRGISIGINTTALILITVLLFITNIKKKNIKITAKVFFKISVLLLILHITHVTSTKNSATLNKHSTAHPLVQNALNCNYCQTPFHRKGHMKKHKRKHTGSTPTLYPPNQIKPSTHKHETGNKPFKIPFNCDECSKPFGRIINTKKHKRCQTTNVLECLGSKTTPADFQTERREPLESEKCSDSFDCIGELKKHKKSHAPDALKRGEAPDAPKYFDSEKLTPASDALHKERGGTIKSDKCNKSFGCISNMKKHNRDHAPTILYPNSTSSNSTPTSPSNTGEEPIIGIQCRKTFDHISDLKQRKTRDTAVGRNRPVTKLTIIITKWVYVASRGTTHIVANVVASRGTTHPVTQVVANNMRTNLLMNVVTPVKEYSHAKNADNNSNWLFISKNPNNAQMSSDIALNACQILAISDT